MTRLKNLRWIMIVGLICISGGGWLLHWRIHPPTDEAANWVPFFLGFLGTFVIPLMFAARRTLAYAYVLNGMAVIIGIIMMAHFSIARGLEPLTLPRILLNTTFPDILVLLTKFALGKALFELSFLKTEADMMRQGHFWRYPNMGWWWVHLVALGAVYALGNLLW